MRCVDIIKGGWIVLIALAFDAGALAAELESVAGELEMQTFDLSENFYVFGFDEGLTAQKLLEKQGVVFPKGASARFVEIENQLEVTNRESDLQIVRAMLDFWVDVEYGKFEAERRRVERKCRHITIPSIEFRDMPLRDALVFLEKASVEFDTDTDLEDERGVRISAVILEEADRSESRLSTPITLRLRKVPLMEALRYVSGLAELDFKISKDGVVIGRFGAKGSLVLSQAYPVPPDFIELLTGYVRTHPAPFCNPVFPEFEKLEKGDSENSRVQELMERQGLRFLKGAPPIVLPDSGLLIVRNEFYQMEAFEDFLDQVLTTTSPDWIESQTSKMQSRVEAIKISDSSFKDVSLTDLVHYLESESWASDTDSSIWNRGLLIELRQTRGPGFDPFSHDEPWDRKVSVEVNGRSVRAVLEMVCEQTGWSLGFSPRGVILAGG